jgi:hypothetical protein
MLSTTESISMAKWVHPTSSASLWARFLVSAELLRVPM